MEINHLIGRQSEVKKLETTLHSAQAEFIAIYGRRRVGKTFLVRQFANSQKGILYFDFSGQQKASLHDQIDNFCVRLQEVFRIPTPIQRPSGWKEALLLLNGFLKKQAKNKKCLLFFDELPWIAGRNSAFVPALDYIWNQYWSKNNKIKLIVCGSAASWIIEKIINAKGGLHNRVTGQINLSPFSLNEVESFLKDKGIKLNEIEILKIYMAIGGIPFYWTYIEKGKSGAEAIDSLFFKKAAPLKEEFHRLFSSLFENSEIHQKIVEVLAGNRQGVSREELLSKLKLKSGGQFSRYLNELGIAGFIQEFIPYGRKKKDHYFRLIDPFCFFYLKWRAEISGGRTSWKSLQNTPRMQTWLGYTFENICVMQESKIKKALELEDLVVTSSSWVYRPPVRSHDKKGVQIDLLWQRRDGVIQIFEMKYSESPFKLDKTYAKTLSDKKEIFKEITKFKGQVFLILISPYGLAPGLWNEDVIDSVINLNQLW